MFFNFLVLEPSAEHNSTVLILAHASNTVLHLGITIYASRSENIVFRAASLTAQEIKELDSKMEDLLYGITITLPNLRFSLLLLDDTTFMCEASSMHHDSLDRCLMVAVSFLVVLVVGVICCNLLFQFIATHMLSAAWTSSVISLSYFHALVSWVYVDEGLCIRETRSRLPFSAPPT